MSPETIDLSAWLPKADAAARLGISERTLDRLVAGGKGPECRARPRPGKKPEPVYNPSDVETLQAAAARPAVFRADSPIGSAALVPAADGMPPALAAAVRFAERLAEIGRPRAGASPPQALWLTIPQAAEYTGLSEVLLRRLARSGALPSIRDGARKVRRADLDNLDAVAGLAGSAEGTQ